jgi:hypothetical protein
MVLQARRRNAVDDLDVAQGHPGGELLLER